LALVGKILYVETPIGTIKTQITLG
jgi:hypothetical protein